MLSTSPAAAEKRIALVIGNSTYQNVTPLDNPSKDAVLMADTLDSLGFTLIGGRAQLNLDKTAMRWRNRAAPEAASAMTKNRYPVRDRLNPSDPHGEAGPKRTSREDPAHDEAAVAAISTARGSSFQSARPVPAAARRRSS